MSKQIGIPGVLGLVMLSVVFVLCWSSGFLVAAVDVGAPLATLLLWRFAVVVAVLVVVLAALRHRSGRAPEARRPPARGDAGGKNPPSDDDGSSGERTSSGQRTTSGQRTSSGESPPPARRPTGATPLRGAQTLRQALVGLFSQVGYVVPVYLAIGLGVSTGTTALVDAVQPLVVATLVGPLLGLRVRGAQWAGLAVGALGVVLVVSADLGSGTAPWPAYLLPLVAMASLVAGTFVERRHPTTSGVLDTLLVHAVVALLAIGTFAVLAGQTAPPATGAFWWTVLFLALSPTLAAYGLYWYLVRRLGITVLNALLFCVAPTTAVAGAVLFGEAFTLGTLGGLVLCATGVGVVLTSEARGRRSEGSLASLSPAT